MPAWTAQFAEVVEFVTRSGLWQEIGQHLRFSHKRGFPVVDLALLFVAMVCGYGKGGIRGFCDDIRPVAKRLAAVAGRQELPASASVSRALCAADRIADLDDQVAWLLSEGSHAGSLVQSPVVQARDANGEGWTVLDFDPSVTALRQRALPEGADLPKPRRRAVPMCGPGYPGRHRGEVQFSTAILSHTAAGLFVQATTHAGNTPFAEALAVAARAATALADRCGLPRRRTLMRFDGAGGHATAISQVVRQDVCHLTRLRQLELLSDPAVAAHLAGTTWYDVTDSGSGPRRQAAELGRYVVGYDERGEAVTDRLVVSRFTSADGEKHGAGVVVDGVQYEPFATDLDPGAWPAADTVTLYYGRCGQENQFCQAIKQLRLGDVFSFDLCGQRLATALLMWVSNLRTALAADHAGDLGTPPVQQARMPASETSLDHAPSQRVPPTEALPAAAPSPAPVPECTEVEPAVQAPAEPPAAAPDMQTKAPVATHKACPRGLLAPLHNIRPSDGCGCYAIYRMAASACRHCPQRNGCTQSTNPAYCREFSVPLPSVALDDRARILALVRGTTTAPTVCREMPTDRAEATNPAPRRDPKPRWTPPKPAASGPLQPAAPCLRPAVLVHLWQQRLQAVAVEVHILAQQRVHRPPPWLAAGPALRQARRLTWSQRDQLNALHAPVAVVRRPLASDWSKPADLHKAA